MLRAVRITGGWVAAVAFLAACTALGWSNSASAQVTVDSGRAVGGVLIDPSGLVQSASPDVLREARKIWEEQLAQPPQALAQAAARRSISLRKLDAELSACLQAGRPIPDEIALLGGLTRIEYVLVYPDRNDIVLVGPAEGWKYNERGAVVGSESGRPILLLDDLVTVLRAVFAPQPSVISCSIDPTPEGVRAVNAVTQGLRGPVNPSAVAKMSARAAGPQRVTLSGIPADSHFARVLVAADYRMKRISMGVDPSPVSGLTSFVSLVQGASRAPGGPMPRWWLAPDYEPLLKDEAGLAWKLQKAAVKTMVEADIYSAEGTREKTVEAAPVHRRWAEMMTAHYEKLAVAEPVFGQVRNCMDLAVTAALIRNENLLGKAGLQLPGLIGQEVPTAQLPAPKAVPAEAVFARVGRSWMFVTGGVMINPWEIAGRSQTDGSLANARSEIAYPDGDAWWAN